jgi:acetyl-CoA carboxylase beta subunit
MQDDWIDNWIPPENYSKQEEHEDWSWEMAEGYMTKCIHCHQMMLISDFGPSRSLICEVCSPNDD